MLNISEFFKRVQGKHAKEIVIRSVIRDAVKNHARFDIPIESISFNSNIAVLEGITAMARSQLYIKKQAILSEINSQQQIRLISDIR